MSQGETTGPAAPVAPADPAFGPMAQALAAAAAAGQVPPPAEADEREARPAKKSRVRTPKNAPGESEAEAYFRRSLAAKGETLARKVGRADGLTAKVMDRIVREEAARQEPARQEPARPEPAGGATARGGDRPPPAEPPPPEGEGEGAARWKPKKDPVRPLPADCPVIPVGAAGTASIYLNPNRAVIVLKPSDHNANGLASLFGRHIDWLWSNFPKFKENGEQTGWKADALRDSLVAAAQAKGEVDVGRVTRGTGGWLDDAGRLVVHTGTGVWVGEERREPGVIDGYIYSAAAAGLQPGKRAETDDEHRRQGNAVRELLTLLDGWNWGGRPDAGEPDAIGRPVEEGGHKLASLYLLGWMGLARAGAAVKYRPILWISGDRGSGKTTLQRVIDHVFGGDLVAASNPTAAGIWQNLGQSSRPVTVDEAENERNPARMDAIVRLAREAATEKGLILRGGGNHVGSSFQMQSAFLLTCIIMPPLAGADWSRQSRLELGPLGGRPEVPVDPARLRAIGGILLRLLMDRWARWPDTLARYRQALREGGCDPRGADQLGSLLAMADLLRFAEPADTDTVQMLTAAAIAERNAEADDDASNSMLMLRAVRGKPVTAFKSKALTTIGELVTRACGLPLDEGDEPPRNEADATTGIESERSPRRCREELRAHGILVEGITGRIEHCRVMLANSHAGLARLFEDTDWRTRPEAVQAPWVQALRRLRDVRQERRNAIGRGYSLPAAVFLERDG